MSIFYYFLNTTTEKEPCQKLRCSRKEDKSQVEWYWSYSGAVCYVCKLMWLKMRGKSLKNNTAKLSNTLKSQENQCREIIELIVLRIWQEKGFIIQKNNKKKNHGLKFLIPCIPCSYKILSLYRIKIGVFASLHLFIMVALFLKLKILVPNHMYTLTY